MLYPLSYEGGDSHCMGAVEGESDAQRAERLVLSKGGWRIRTAARRVGAFLVEIRSAIQEGPTWEHDQAASARWRCMLAIGVVAAPEPRRKLEPGRRYDDDDDQRCEHHDRGIVEQRAGGTLLLVDPARG